MTRLLKHEAYTQDGILNLYKRLGETPRERLDRLRAEHEEYSNEVLSYAGRLDPMAEGVLLCLVGAANRRHDEYLQMDKEYVLDVLFGFATDTFDVLGKVIERGSCEAVTRADIEDVLGYFRGAISQQYPPYSSKTVEGKALFEYAREGMLGAITLPQRGVHIFDIKLEDVYKVPGVTLREYAERNVPKVQGDFRQEEIVRDWQLALARAEDESYAAATIKISCSSGTYARAIANEMGRHLGVPALALHILRTRAGNHSIDESWE